MKFHIVMSKHFVHHHHHHQRPWFQHLLVYDAFVKRCNLSFFYNVLQFYNALVSISCRAVRERESVQDHQRCIFLLSDIFVWYYYYYYYYLLNCFVFIQSFVVVVIVVVINYTIFECLIYFVAINLVLWCWGPFDLVLMFSAFSALSLLQVLFCVRICAKETFFDSIFSEFLFLWKLVSWMLYRLIPLLRLIQN